MYETLAHYLGIEEIRVLRLRCYDKAFASSGHFQLLAKTLVSIENPLVASNLLEGYEQTYNKTLNIEYEITSIPRELRLFHAVGLVDENHNIRTLVMIGSAELSLDEIKQISGLAMTAQHIPVHFYLSKVEPVILNSFTTETEALSWERSNVLELFNYPGTDQTVRDYFKTPNDVFYRVFHVALDTAVDVM